MGTMQDTFDRCITEAVRAGEAEGETTTMAAVAAVMLTLLDSTRDAVAVNQMMRLLVGAKTANRATRVALATTVTAERSATPAA